MAGLKGLLKGEPLEAVFSFVYIDFQFFSFGQFI